jgi:hypothetical protein
MSWSVNFIGTPEKIASALQKQSESLSGQSKEEFDEVLPHMVGLVKQNYNKTSEPVLKISASGHRFSGHGHDTYCNCTVHIENLGGVLV